MLSKLACALILSTLLLINNFALAEDNWKFEFVPYVWLPGIDGDIKVRGREESIDLSFDDISDAVEVGGSLLAVAQYRRWVLYTQADYFSLDSKELDDRSSNSDIESEVLIGNAAFGRQFRTFGEQSTIDILLGVRYLSMENSISGRDEDPNEWLDGIVMFRPSFQLLDWLRFNPSLSVGTGDSEITYELQPQFELLLTDVIVARLGYRRLYYDVGDEDRGFEGEFSGVLLGLGLKF